MRENAGKKKKYLFNKYLRIITNTFNRQSEKDFPRRSVKFGFTDGSRVTASNKVGNAIVLFFCFYILDTKEFLEIAFKNYKKKKRYHKEVGLQLMVVEEL